MHGAPAVRDSSKKEGGRPGRRQMASLKDHLSQDFSYWQPRCPLSSKGVVEGLVAIFFLLLTTHVLLDHQQQARLQVFLGVGFALLGFSLLLGCTLCWHRRRKSHLGNGKASAHMLMELGLGLSSGTKMVAIQQQYTEIEGQVLSTSAPSVDNLPGLSHQDSPPRSIRCGRGSLSSIPLFQRTSTPAMPTQGRERRCTISEGSLSSGRSDLLSRPILGTSIPQSYTFPRDLVSGSVKPRPQLCFTLSYRQPEGVITVTVIGVSHLPKGTWAGRNTYVKVYLLPNSAEPHCTALRRKSLSPEFHEQFCFSPYSPEELPGLTLRFAVYAKGFHNLRDSFVGEVMFPCAQVAWNPGVSSTYTQELSSIKTKLKKCLSAQDVSLACLPSTPPSMGQLFLLLQYQALANRIKVLVRKAENLGRLRRMPGTPDHFVIIQLYHNGKVIDTKETKAMAGYSPVWNSPFLFSVPVGDIREEDLSLEFTVMQTRIYTRSCTVGRVLIGPDAPEMGQTHWKEMCSRGNVESARWHSVLPENFHASP